MRFGIALKLTAMLAAFCILAIGLTGYYTYHATREILVNKASQDIVLSTRIMGRRFSMAADDVAKDALFFAGMPGIRYVIGSGRAAEIARQNLAEQFRSMLSEHPTYYQIRFISAQNNGIELVRVDRDSNGYKIVRGQDLQEKMQFPYVYESLRLAAGQVHYSNIFINREIGAHVGLNKPTLQVATPVQSADGRTLGVLVINVDLNRIFALLKADLRSEYQLYLANQAGDFLIHPDNSMTFGFDYGRRFLVQDTFKPVAALINEISEAVAVHSNSVDEKSDVVGGFVRIPFGDERAQSFVIIGMTVPLDIVLAETDAMVRNSVRIAIGMSLAAIVMSILVAMLFSRPLKRLVRVVQRFSDTRELTPETIHNHDEIGVLAQSIYQMQENILDHLGELNIQNEILQQEIHEREQMERYEQFRSQSLELLAGDNSILSILKAIVQGVERLNPGMLCSILLLDKDGKHLGKGIAPSLPDFYNTAIEGVEIGLGVGSCGTAAYTKERIIVEDIQTHPYWALYKELAAKAGLGSCWSQPILSSTDQVLGTFAIYHHQAYTPTESDIQLIEQSARLASIAIERKRSEEALHYSEKRFRDVNDAAGEYVWEMGTDMVYTYVSNRSVDVKGYVPDELLGHTPMEFMPVEDIPHVREIVNRAIASNTSFKLQHRDITKSGTLLWEEVNGVPFFDEHGELMGLRGTGMNITDRKRAEEEIKSLAFYDPLTHLPNRRLLVDRLQHALASSTRSGREGALLFIDLDNFKTLNDTLGHDIGDLLLQQVALRLASCVREGDTVARLGGDEFVVMLEELSEQTLEAAAQTESIGEKILLTLNQPYLLAAHEYRNSPSIGATLFGNKPQSIEELLKQADIAMYQAKKAGRNTLRFFDPQMQETVIARALLERELSKALENDQFQLYYQIQMTDLNEPFGAEALIRWIHPERGLIPPNHFIPLAEEVGLILPIGLWVLDTACNQIKIWEKNASTRELVLAVNVSARSFFQDDFVTQIQTVLQRHAINPKRLKLEITESMMLNSIEQTIEKMNALKKLGVQFAMDDFGTGYSSLQYLKRLPLDQLKIDQSFVRDIATDSSDKAIVTTIVAMAHSLNLDVIAEGVETEQQRQLLIESGCSQYQGYLFGKPAPIRQFEESLKPGLRQANVTYDI
ncbi:EAL domain-containing protein [Sideroxydans lithotrophicus]|uniref:Diguanylate cyclase/phosphodiesterase with PAS/PAC and GAF sensor(S) n=1 Tax=Sideroxydans lithotrophicus (strain ES-1) TaxID=580332 RepID=D5CSG3_SIDLE|nr:EAL domain-containing protein [Sideroxydans lithotrophicus]ADE11899.1 diguanylate cyclase/phosphodiesterase with PAS/PAC and GAF sensor(s) [Sideroxydans lithotrophicus ES-1]